MSRKLRYLGRDGIACLLALSLTSLSTLTMAENPQQSVLLGQVFAKKLCQACHQFKGARQAGNIAPPFVAMKTRFPDRKKIHAIIYDPQKAIKPDTMMPPFGRHGFVTGDEIEMIIDFLYTQ